MDCVDAIGDDDGPLAVARSSWWVEGAGGFGGPRSDPSASAPPVLPERRPDVTLAVATTPEQAALYRLSGDRNPVHIDPEVARAAGQPRPFLHGLCTLGIAGLGMARAAGAGRRLTSLAGRFTSPVFPGDDVTTEVWWTGEDTALARVTSAGTPVIAPVQATFAD
ncbi:hypothetical protein FSW04_06895 [Baekduia soli]|uniref:MaoC-like domain-containing protein n=1 Tax=Baekduia soli TaxID=496014 RepID=A0A5B8UC99_9ACTN|nr:hypothetical protein FSW04_06895 [Baekduia soli]